MTPLQQLSILALLATAVGSLPFAASPAAAVALPGVPAAAAAIRKPHITPAIAEAIRRNAARAIAIDPPAPYRQHNWGQEGSCAWASLVNLLHWQGRHAQAEYVRTHYSEGAGPDELYPAMDRLGLPYATVPGHGYVRGDEAFLDWCCRTRRGACVPVLPYWCAHHQAYHAAHMINLVGLDNQFAYTLDNNGPLDIQRRPRAEFLAEWKQSGGWAFTIVGTPNPPKPWTLSLKEKP